MVAWLQINSAREYEVIASLFHLTCWQIILRCHYSIFFIIKTFIPQPHLVALAHVSMVVTVSIKEPMHISVNVSMDTLEPTVKYQVSYTDPIQIT